MQFFRHANSIYGGSDVIIGASYDLLLWFVAAGAAFILMHAVFMAVTKTGERASH